MTATSAISQVIANLNEAMDATRAEIAQLNERIDVIEAERRRVEQAPPHSADIVDAFVRGLDAHASDFRSQLASSLNETYVAAENAAQAVTKPAHLLTIEAHKPSAEILRTRVMTGEPAALNLSALAYLLRDRIREELPDLVDRLCPQSRHGMKQDQRKEELASLDANLTELRAERDAKIADLHAARQAALGRRD